MRQPGRCIKRQFQRWRLESRRLRRRDDVRGRHPDDGTLPDRACSGCGMGGAHPGE